MNTATQGVLAMIGCCTIWGLSSMFYKLLGAVPPLEILAHRTIWSLVFFALLLGFQSRLKEVRRSFIDWRSGCLTVLAALMILANWYLFIWSVGAERATEASLGYYIYPLVSVLLGWLIYSDRLFKLQWIAIAFAACAVSALTYGLGAAPWVSLMLAGTFAFYGLMKKQLDVGPVVSVTSEVMLVAPFAAIFLLLTWHNGQAAFGQDFTTTALLILAGPMTAVPLILFSYAARRATMSTIGLVGYINPTLQFLCAVMVFSEPFTGWHVMAFTMIWTALALYSAVLWSQERASRKASVVAAASGTTVM
jgi:chloramphenicol-sensitive protein RarD